MSIMGAAVSGMNADTTWLASISQNIANANTTGYKNNQTSFEALVDQTSAASYDAAGVSTHTISLNSMQGIVVGGQSAVTDLAVQGNGFFVVSNSAGDTFLTRDGSFVPDASGNLVNSAGYYLMGYNIQNGPATITANSLTGTQVVNVDKAGEQATPSSTGTFAANLPSASAVGQTETTDLVAYDNLGSAQNLAMTFANNGGNSWQLTVTDSTGATTTTNLTFNPNTGKLTSLGGGGTTLNVNVPNGQTVALDLSGMTQLAAGYSVNTANVNGNAPSSVTGVTIGNDGTLSFQFANGQTIAGYQIPLASVASPDNLTSVSGNAYQANFASGTVKIGTAGQAGFGTIQSSSLESSTVDLATELTEMINAQSAYEANSKSFQTGATLLDVLNNLKP
ncbi:MAG TPA: flagellar hook protein FlgE [Roseiarcus sp.]|nr:flagellar hook protein FlgE [Roseiarcus sp.]